MTLRILKLRTRGEGMLPMNHTRHSHNNWRWIYSNVNRLSCLKTPQWVGKNFNKTRWSNDLWREKFDAHVLAILKHISTLLTICFLGFSCNTSQEDHSSDVSTMTHYEVLKRIRYTSKVEKQMLPTSKLANKLTTENSSQLCHSPLRNFGKALHFFVPL